jgi:hypothetical protein
LSHCAITEANETGIVSSDPQASLRVLHDSPDPDGVENSFGTGNSREPDAVEAHQTGVRTEPEVSIAGLTQRIDLHIRESLFRLPGPAEILREFAMGIEGAKAGWGNACRQKENAHAKPSPSWLIIVVR